MVNNKVNEKDRYGNLLEKAKQKEAKEKSDMISALNNVIKWGEQASKERDEEWEQKEKFRNDMLDKAKQRLNKDYKI